MTRSILAVLAASFLVGGCAANAVDATAEPRTEPQYQTGSNIAKRKTDGASDGVSVVNREEIERARENANPNSFIPKGK
jgi:uncharacterized lipoprotein YajG